MLAIILHVTANCGRFARASDVLIDFFITYFARYLYFVSLKQNLQIFLGDRETEVADSQKSDCYLISSFELSGAKSR